MDFFASIRKRVYMTQTKLRNSSNDADHLESYDTLIIGLRKMKEMFMKNKHIPDDEKIEFLAIYNECREICRKRTSLKYIKKVPFLLKLILGRI